MREKDDSAGLAAGANDTTAVPASPAPHVAHTPGPWMSFDSGTMVITCDSGHDLIASLEDTEIESTAEREANAHLIAAAPEMLDALKDADDLLSNFLPYDDSRWMKVRAAIAKAEGTSK